MSYDPSWVDDSLKEYNGPQETPIEGVWVVRKGNDISVHKVEIEALRAANDRSGKAQFIPYGEVISGFATSNTSTFHHIYAPGTR